MKDFSYASFICSRSGTYKPKVEDRDRQLKSQGSKKLGFNCTAGIQVKDYGDHVSVNYFNTHYKHSSGVEALGHLPIPVKVKEDIAGKLIQGIAEKRILQDIRQSVGPQVEREHLITNKDLQNIKKIYGITLPSQGSVLSSDETSVHSWVEEMKSNECNPVLFYKRQDEDHSLIGKQDFMLVLMTAFQKNILSRFGADRICIDSTHGISGYQFELVTILTIDEFEEGIPVAFCIMSSVDTKMLTHFFNCVKAALSRNLNPRIFMSDDAVMFQNAWVNVFGPCSQYLLCAWHLDRAWQKHLTSLKREIRDDVYKTLKSLMYELDSNTFKIMIENFTKMLKEDTNTKDFYNYFKQYYYPRCQMWAYCFHKGARINTNMHIESFHRCLKHIYLEGEKTKRIDKVILELMKLVNDKNFDSFIKTVKGKITKKTTENFKRHKIGKTLKAEIEEIKDNEWKVIHENKIYAVTKMHTCSNTCVISCRNCAICSTAYACNCHDNLISNFICKHIHFKVVSFNEHKDYIGPLNTQNDFHDENRNERSLLQNSQLSCHETNKLEIRSLSSKLNMLQTMDDNVSRQIKHHINAIKHLMGVTEENSLASARNSEPYNKKITKQKRFYAVKKSRPCKKIKLSKPSCEEVRVKKSILLGNKEITTTNSNLDHAYL